MGTARKIFLGRVYLPARTATSLYQMMRDSPLHWGYESTALTTPSFDSITGSNVQVTPDAAVFMGIDNTLTNNGIAKAGGTTFSLADYGDQGGVIDPNAIWFYNDASGTGMALVFEGR